MRKIYWSFLTVLAFAATTLAGKVERATEKVTLEEAKSIEIEGELGAGKFTISVAEMPEAATFDIEYDKRTVKYHVDYYEKGEKGFLTFESDRRKNIGFDTGENRWDIVLSNKYESTLDLNIGACDANFDLGGLPLKELSIDIGAAAGVIDFSKPNPVRLEEFRMDAGATSLEMHMLGNANFSRFKFAGGVGSFNFDF
ncbi:MAG: toast rack family protein, partial [Candidatus Zixiibacteriota bacterium]